MAAATGRTAGPLTDAGRTRIEAAVREAERGTAAEIVVVVAPEAGTSHAVLLWPALAALALPLPLLLALPRLDAHALYAAQLALTALGLGLALLPPVRHRLTPAAARLARARRLAREQFFEQGLHRTAARTGVLLFVSLGDRCAEIIADAGVEGALPDEAWRPCLDRLLAEARRGRLEEGVVAALASLGDTLRERLPAGAAVAGREDRNEVPDRPVVL